MRHIVLCLILGFGSLAFVFDQASVATAANVPDTTITSDVLSKLAGRDQAYKGVDVRTRDGVVTLKGGVRSEEHKTLATDLAKAVPGVKDVNNELTVISAK